MAEATLADSIRAMSYRFTRFFGMGGLHAECWEFDANLEQHVPTREAYFDCANPVQHAAGEAFCYACNHTWAAVAPTGTTDLECPSCKRTTGRWKFGFYPSDGQQVLSCNCGNQLYYLTPDGHLCANCGVYMRY